MVTIEPITPQSVYLFKAVRLGALQDAPYAFGSTYAKESQNEPAMRFYERLGFTRTGRTEPYPNDPAVLEYEMSRPVP